MADAQQSPGPWKIDGRVIRAADGQPVTGCVVSRMKPGDAELIAAAPQLKAENERLTDLVRYARIHLHKEDLISDEEYVNLVQDHECGQRVARLETYDEMRKQLVDADSYLSLLIHRKHEVNNPEIQQEVADLVAEIRKVAPGRTA